MKLLWYLCLIYGCPIHLEFVLPRFEKEITEVAGNSLAVYPFIGNYTEGTIGALPH